MHSAPQRSHIVLTDGVIAGEGDGPLYPRPVHFGYLSWSSDVVVGDYVNAIAMGFDPNRLSILREATRVSDYPLTHVDPWQQTIRINGRCTTVSALKSSFGDKKFAPPREWRGFL